MFSLYSEVALARVQLNTFYCIACVYRCSSNRNPQAVASCQRIIWLVTTDSEVCHFLAATIVWIVLYGLSTRLTCEINTTDLGRFTNRLLFVCKIRTYKIQINLITGAGVLKATCILMMSKDDCRTSSISKISRYQQGFAWSATCCKNQNFHHALKWRKGFIF